MQQKFFWTSALAISIIGNCLLAPCSYAMHGGGAAQQEDEEAPRHTQQGKSLPVLQVPADGVVYKWYKGKWTPAKDCPPEYTSSGGLTQIQFVTQESALDKMNREYRDHCEAKDGSSLRPFDYIDHHGNGRYF